MVWSSAESSIATMSAAKMRLTRRVVSTGGAVTAGDEPVGVEDMGVLGKWEWCGGVGQGATGTRMEGAATVGSAG
ncbi:hypothetical protein GCM10009851_04210 [Herbiconiux moechotypicola]|uniref:Uncharacterized protein n=1 Tax=Herbiconiux moechotypicola TaxID=637393 RepID=A0ABN3D939_9MICO